MSENIIDTSDQKLIEAILSGSDTLPHTEYRSHLKMLLHEEVSNLKRLKV